MHYLRSFIVVIVIYLHPVGYMVTSDLSRHLYNIKLNAIHFVCNAYKKCGHTYFSF